jgi:hypothetical protein
MHEALHIALRALGAIGTTQDVDHVGLPLPPQGPPDCAFYMLTRLACKLTGESPQPHLWPVITRIGGLWTGFHVYRRLLEESAILNVVDRCRERFISSLRPVPKAHIVAALSVSVDEASFIENFLCIVCQCFLGSLAMAMYQGRGQGPIAQGQSS